MKKIVRITMLLLVGLMLSTNVSAYYVDGTVIKSNSTDLQVGGIYEGYIGNVNIGLSSIGNTTVSPDWIGSHYVSDGNGSYVSNFPAFKTDGAVTTHWYLFSASMASSIVGVFELGSNITEFTAYFYSEDSSDTPFYQTSSYSGSFNDIFTSLNTGDLLMKIEGKADGSNSSYRARMFSAAVPLPPAALLFISALAGFGVIGRRKASS